MTSEFEVLPEETPAESATTDSAEAQEVKPVYNGPSPGELLRKAREGKDLSLDDIVMQSRMSKETVKALEEDRDPPQNAWVYVRGYYRKYARVLGIPEEEILHAHEQYVGGAPAPQPVSAEWAPQDVSPGGGVPRVVLVLVAGILFGGLLWWLMPVLMSGSDAPAEQSTQIKAAPLGSESRVKIDSVISSTPLVKPAPVSEIAQESGQAGEEEASEAGQTDDAVADGTMSDDSLSSVAETSDNSIGQDAPTPQSVHEDAASSPRPKLALEFTDRSWVNVVDADGKKLLDGIVKAGVQLAVEGQPPFKVFLGYAPGVEISYQGRMIDTAPYTSSNNTARFTIGAEETPAP